MAQLKVYKHVKSGYIVHVLHLARLQTAHSCAHLNDMEIMVVYEHSGNIWVRSEEEFDDGRFREI